MDKKQNNHEKVELVSNTNGTEYVSQNTNGTDDGRATAVKLYNQVNQHASYNERYPYTYYIPVTSTNLVKSIIGWMFESIICAILLIIIYPILIPLYIIVILQCQFNLIKNKKDIFKASGCQECRKFLYKLIFDLGVNTLLTINALIIAPIFYFNHTFDENIEISGSLLVPSVLFFIYRKSFLLRITRWYLRFKRGSNTLKQIFPYWFLKYFLQSGLQLHHLLIKNYISDEIYLRTDRKCKGTLKIGSSQVEVSKFIIPYKMARNFYDVEHVIYRTLVSFAILSQLAIPFIFAENGLDFVMHIILSIGTFWVMIAIWFEIEGRIIFSLLKYLDRMRQFGELLYLDPGQKKDRTKYRFFDIKRHKRAALERATHCKFVVKLCDGFNANVWTENWLMMYNETNIYFNKFEYILYSVIISVIAAVLILIYTFFNGEKIFNTNVAVSGVGCLAMFLIWIELLMISFKFYKLEKKHMESLINQKVWIKQRIFELSSNNGINDRNEIFRLESCVSLINELLQKMKIKGMSPRIAGIQMNNAFVRVTWSLTAGVITAGVSYYVKTA